MMVPLPPLKPMDQSKCGATQVMEVSMHPLVVAIPKFIQLGLLLLKGGKGTII
jgi:hypothetical protein